MNCDLLCRNSPLTCNICELPNSIQGIGCWDGDGINRVWGGLIEPVQNESIARLTAFTELYGVTDPADPEPPEENEMILQKSVQNG